MTNDPRLIRAHIALFQGKPGETKRLVNDFVEDQSNPENTRQHPLIQWLEAQSFLHHRDRVAALTTLVETTPADNTYHQIATNFLEDERKFATLIEKAQTNEPRRFMGLRLWIWGVAGMMVVAAIIGIAIVLTTGGNFGAPEPTATETGAGIAQDITPTETPTPTSTLTPTIAPTPTAEQNAPVPVDPKLWPNVIYDSNIGGVTIAAVDPAVKVVLDQEGNIATPIPGSHFYGVAVIFDCLTPLCYAVPEANLAVLLKDRENLEPIFAKQRITVPNAQFTSNMNGLEPATAPSGLLEGKVALGTKFIGWVIFEIPDNQEPGTLLILPNPIVNNEGTEEPQPPIELVFPEIGE